MQKGEKHMDLHENIIHEEYNESLEILLPCHITNNTQAYICMCINEILHSLKVTHEEDYNIIYAMISDSAIFTEF